MFHLISQTSLSSRLLLEQVSLFATGADKVVRSTTQLQRDVVCLISLFLIFCYIILTGSDICSAVNIYSHWVFIALFPCPMQC